MHATSVSGRLSAHVPPPNRKYLRQLRTSKNSYSPCMVASAVAAPSAPPTNDEAYAVIVVGGLKQYVYEGSSFACSKQSIEEVSLGGTVRFPKVLAMKHDGELFKGRPYLEGAVVEGRLEDEFRGPNTWSSMSMSMASEDIDEDSEAQSDPSSQRMLRRILITRIHQA